MQTVFKITNYCRFEIT